MNESEILKKKYRLKGYSRRAKLEATKYLDQYIMKVSTSEHRVSYLLLKSLIISKDPSNSCVENHIETCRPNVLA